MNTKILLGAVVTAFVLTSFAADTSLSPRAKDSQIKIVTSSIGTQGGTVGYAQPVSSALPSNQNKVVNSAAETPAGAVASTAATAPQMLSPRAMGNQLKTVSGAASDRNPYLECRATMTGSPKAVQSCIEDQDMPYCMTVAPLK